MNARPLLIAVGFVACLGCAGEVESAPEVTTTVEHHPRFIGLWSLNERAASAGYARAIWELGSNGELTMRRSLDASKSPEILGGVRRSKDGVFCRINTSWSSRGADHLRFSTSCTDGIARMVTYRFPDGSSEPSTDVDPILEDVSGEAAGWSVQDGWGLQMRKCATLDGCS